MAVELATQRCEFHAGRRAAACCPKCGRFFCRECVTEHQGKVFCAGCLASAGQSMLRRRSLARWVGRGVLCLLSLTILWAVFYSVGYWRLSQPSLFHQSMMESR